MQINLPPELEAYVRGKVNAGEYANLEELVKDSIRFMERVEGLAAEQREQLRREVRVGLDQLDRGEYVELTDKLVEDIKRRGRERMTQRLRKKSA